MVLIGHQHSFLHCLKNGWIFGKSRVMWLWWVQEIKFILAFGTLKVKTELTFNNILHCENCRSPNSNVTFSDVLLSCLFKVMWKSQTANFKEKQLICFQSEQKFTHLGHVCWVRQTLNLDGHSVSVRVLACPKSHHDHQQSMLRIQWHIHCHARIP